MKLLFFKIIAALQLQVWQLLTMIRITVLNSFGSFQTLLHHPIDRQMIKIQFKGRSMFLSKEYININVLNYEVCRCIERVIGNLMSIVKIKVKHYILNIYICITYTY